MFSVTIYGSPAYRSRAPDLVGVRSGQFFLLWSFFRMFQSLGVPRIAPAPILVVSDRGRFC